MSSRAPRVVLSAILTLAAATASAAPPAGKTRPEHASCERLPYSKLDPRLGHEGSSGPWATSLGERLLVAWVADTDEGATLVAKLGTVAAPLALGEPVTIAKVPRGAEARLVPPLANGGRFAAVWTHGGVTSIVWATDAEGRTWSAPVVLHEGRADAAAPVVGPLPGGILVAWAEESTRVGQAPDGEIPPDPARSIVLRRFDLEGRRSGEDKAIWSRPQVPAGDMETLTPLTWTRTRSGPALVVAFRQEMKGQYGHELLRARDAQGTAWAAPETIWQFGVGNWRMVPASGVFDAGGSLAATQIMLVPSGYDVAHVSFGPLDGGGPWRSISVKDMGWSRPFAPATKEPYQPAWTYVTGAGFTPAGATTATPVLLALTAAPGDRIVAQAAIGGGPDTPWKVSKATTLREPCRIARELWVGIDRAGGSRTVRAQLLGVAAGDGASALVRVRVPLPKP